MTTPIAGHCHCGAVRVLLDPGKPLADLPLRACQCGFCRRHGALTTSHPGGRLHIEAAPGALNHYRFGHGVTDFLLCDECGTYVAATVADDEGLRAVVNVRGADLPGFEGRAPEPMSYETETAEERLARRKTHWMPAVLIEAQPNA